MKECRRMIWAVQVARNREMKNVLNFSLNCKRFVGGQWCSEYERNVVKGCGLDSSGSGCDTVVVPHELRSEL